MSLFDDHFAAKIAAQSRAWSMDKEETKGKKNREPAAPKEGVCDKCHKETLVKSYRVRQTDVSDGAASYGTVTKYFCEDCAPKSRRMQDAEVPPMSNKQVKNLMRFAKKGLLK